jgi:cardiolipin synthase
MSRRTASLLIGFVAIALFILQNLGTARDVLTGNLQSKQSTNQQAAASSAGTLGHLNDSADIPYVIVPAQPLTLYTEPEDGIAPVIKEITDASSSVDLMMYELQDSQIENALASASARGIHVRVLLNEGLHGSSTSANESAYAFLKSHTVPVEWTSSVFALTHQKTLIVDGKEALIMTFNLTPKYYSTSRDFGVLDSDTHDVAAIEQTFSDDWNAGTLENESGAKVTASVVTAPAGDDLVWSPGSKAALLSIINASKKSLLIYNEEMSDPDIIAALAAAAGRGVNVEIAMTDSSDWHTAFTTLSNAGAHVRTYSPKASLYIHAKMILSDDTQAFLGSENFSTASLDDNRELGLFISTPSILSQLETTFNSDWQGATPFESQ